MRNRFTNRQKNKGRKHRNNECHSTLGQKCRRRQGFRCRLSDLDSLQGQKCRVLYIDNNCRFKQRLHQMGIIDETEIEIIRKAPLNDPIEIKVGDFHLGIRRDEAKEIFVEALEE